MRGLRQRETDGPMLRRGVLGVRDDGTVIAWDSDRGLWVNTGWRLPPDPDGTWTCLEGTLRRVPIAGQYCA